MLIVVGFRTNPQLLYHREALGSQMDLPLISKTSFSYSSCAQHDLSKLEKSHPSTGKSWTHTDSNRQQNRMLAKLFFPPCTAPQKAKVLPETFLGSLRFWISQVFKFVFGFSFNNFQQSATTVIKNFRGAVFLSKGCRF